MSASALSSVPLEVRKYDRERFVTALFAPTALRDDLFVLYAFNAEVARIKSLVREPLAGSIRLQWWRDVLNGERPQTEVEHHPIAGPLMALVGSGRFDTQLLLTLLDAREQDIAKTEFASMAQLVGYVDATAGNLAQAALQVLGAKDDDSLKAGRGAAIAYGLIGLLRSLGANLSQGWQILPVDLLRIASIDPDKVSSKIDVSQPVQQIAQQAQTTLTIARKSKVQRTGLSVCLHGTLAQGHLHQLRKAQFNPFVSTLAKPQTMPVRLLWQMLWGRF